MEHFDVSAPVPSVDPADVEAVWRFMNQVFPGVRDPFEESGGAATCPSTVSVDIGLYAEQCSEGADVYAVWLRTALLGVLYKMGMLAPWQQGGELNKAVFQVAATIPIANLNEFNPDAFIASLTGASDLQ